jgi:hypothetical protein
MNKNPTKSQIEPISSLQQWFARQCNGDWEHQFGIRIDTLDNPGWIVDIDLVETELEEVYEGRIDRTRSETDWIDITINAEKFIATGSADRLDEIISQFCYFVENRRLNESNLV